MVGRTTAAVRRLFADFAFELFCAFLRLLCLMVLGNLALGDCQTI
jgi:hypothetical protein